MSPRPRKPIEEHFLTGTKPQWVTEEKGTGVVAAGRPKMPKGLSPVAEAEWKRIVPLLNKRGTLTKADAPALEIYVVSYARWKKVAAMAEANPVTEVSWVGSDDVERTKVVEHPASAMAARLEGSLRQMLQQFSATPASRDKTKSVAPVAPPPAPVPGTELLDRPESEPTMEEPPTPEPDIDIFAINLEGVGE
jgi:P27 family predicted phage terminase small subunit